MRLLRSKFAASSNKTSNKSAEDTINWKRTDSQSTKLPSSTPGGKVAFSNNYSKPWSFACPSIAGEGPANALGINSSPNSPNAILPR